MKHKRSRMVQAQGHYTELQVGVPYANLMSNQILFAQVVAQHFDLDSDHVIPTLGTTGAIEAVRNHVFSKSHKQEPIALTVTPDYWRARESFQGLGFKIIEVETQPRGFKVDEIEIIMSAKEKEPDLIYLSLPNNPTGAIFEPEIIIQSVSETTAIMLDLTLPRPGEETKIVLSELYKKFRERENLFLVSSTSKSHGTAEHRIGWAICTHYRDAEALRKENRNVLPIPSIMEGMRHLGKPSSAIEGIADSFTFLKEGEKKGKFSIIRPQRQAETGYVLIEVKIDEKKVKRMLEEKQIRVMWGSALGLNDQFIRLETLVPQNIKFFIDEINLL